MREATRSWATKGWSLDLWNDGQADWILETRFSNVYGHPIYIYIYTYYIYIYIYTYTYVFYIYICVYIIPYRWWYDHTQHGYIIQLSTMAHLPKSCQNGLANKMFNHEGFDLHNMSTLLQEGGWKVGRICKPEYNISGEHFYLFNNRQAVLAAFNVGCFRCFWTWFWGPSISSSAARVLLRSGWCREQRFKRAPFCHQHTVQNFTKLIQVREWGIQHTYLNETHLRIGITKRTKPVSIFAMEPKGSSTIQQESHLPKPLTQNRVCTTHLCPC